VARVAVLPSRPQQKRALPAAPVRKTRGGDLPIVIDGSRDFDGDVRGVDQVLQRGVCAVPPVMPERLQGATT
jgi:hypothetical protein